ncbi:hypothetical protein I551_0693 [Mycobacterium ulcerans str. Harvey]|uniref:Uncharacterized protein n=1 Tax=Mycobacterium ulcerans str. Harvey TaxID=1299332 RepID=A0ABN0R6N2_MYCUL|nr:hypothetical protein I551_0693 [Mycobacterium ulcerans str. Harvey]
MILLGVCARAPLVQRPDRARPTSPAVPLPKPWWAHSETAGGSATASVRGTQRTVTDPIRAGHTAHPSSG